MIKAVYDTNILASGIVALHTSISFMIDVWINDEVELIISEPLLNELTRTFEKSYFSSRLTQKQMTAFTSLIRSKARIVQIITPIPKIATHPEDDIVLATAESGKASFIVTGDHGLQNLKKFKDVLILSPRAFYEMLRLEKVS